MDEGFALLRKLIAELPSKLVADQKKQSPEDSSVKTSSDEEEVDEAE